MLTDFLLTIWIMFVFTSIIFVRNSNEIFLLMFHDSFFIIFYSIYKVYFQKKYAPNVCNHYLFYVILICCSDIVIFYQLMYNTLNIYYNISVLIVLITPVLISLNEIKTNIIRNNIKYVTIHSEV